MEIKQKVAKKLVQEMGYFIIPKDYLKTLTLRSSEYLKMSQNYDNVQRADLMALNDGRATALIQVLEEIKSFNE